MEVLLIDSWYTNKQDQQTILLRRAVPVSGEIVPLH